MSARSQIRISTLLRRKDPRLPVFVVIPGRKVAEWALTGTTIVEGSANGIPIGRRSIKAWGKGSADWFIEFTAPFCTSANLSVGDKVVLALQPADASLPAELGVLISRSKRLAGRWSALSEAARRNACEHIHSAKGNGTRQRRAAAIAAKLEQEAGP